MSAADAARIALRAILANRLRSTLTALGMIIGVSSVIVLIAVGQGTQEGVASEIRGLGSDLMFVQPGTDGNQQGAAGQATSLVLGDAEAVAEANIPGVLGVAPQISINAQAIGGVANQAVTVIGTTSDYPFVRQASLAQGSFITLQDVEDGSLSIVLGATVAATLFPDGGAIGDNVSVSLGGGRIVLEFDVVGTPLDQPFIQFKQEVDAYIEHVSGELSEANQRAAWAGLLGGLASLGGLLLTWSIPGAAVARPT